MAAVTTGEAEGRAERDGLLAGRTILVTGAASGIGFSYATACARAGADLVLIDRDVDELAARAGDLGEFGVHRRTLMVDIADPEQVDAAWDTVERDHAIDGAFLNAGMNAGPGIRHPGGRIDEFARETWHGLLAVNLHGFFLTLQRTAGILKTAGRGSIVVTGSTAGIRPEPLMGYAYVASKAAVHAVCQQAALELVGYGVRINVIAPGAVVTNIGGRAPASPEKVQMWTRTIPMQRRADPSELEGLALLLISDQGSFMTGGVYVADGGASALTQLSSDELRLSADDPSLSQRGVRGDQMDVANA